MAALAKKELKRTIREPAVLFMIFLFPIVFVFAFGASFGGVGGAQTVSYHIGVVNMDQASNVNASQILVTALVNTKIINLDVYASNATAQSDLSQGNVQAVIVIPSDFSGSLASYQAFSNEPSKWTNTSVQLYLDKGSLVATQAIPPIIQQALASVAGQTRQLQIPFQIQTASLVEAKTTSALDFIAPGMFTFASIFLIMMVAQSFTTGQGKRNDETHPNIAYNPFRVHGKPSSLIHVHRADPSSLSFRNDVRFRLQTCGRSILIRVRFLNGA